MAAGVPPGLWRDHARLGGRAGDLHGRAGLGQRDPRPAGRPRRQPLGALCKTGVPDRPGHRAESLVDRPDARAVRRSGRPDGAGRRRGYGGPAAAVGRGARLADNAHGRDPAGGGPGGHHGERSQPALDGRPLRNEYLGRRPRGGPEHFCPPPAVGHPAHALADLPGQSPGRRRGVGAVTPAVQGRRADGRRTRGRGDGRRTRRRGDAETRREQCPPVPASPRPCVPVSLRLPIPASPCPRVPASRRRSSRTGLPGRGDRGLCLLPHGDGLVSHVGADPGRHDFHLRADPDGGPAGHRPGRRGV